MSKTRVDETEIVRQLLSGAEYSRDQLPYTNEFGALKKEFERRASRKLTNNEFWRFAAYVGKRDGLR